MKTIAEVPTGSRLSRLTDHYFQIIANRAPIGFEAEFVNQRGNNTMYRGILMPLSSDGSTIDFVYRSEEHTSELQSLMRISYAGFCLIKKKLHHSFSILLPLLLFFLLIYQSSSYILFIFSILLSH